MKSASIKLGLLLAAVAATVAWFRPEWLVTVREALDPEVGHSAISGNRVRIVYKWRDAQGRVIYGSAPPDGGQAVERLEIDAGANVIPSRKAGDPGDASVTSAHKTGDDAVINLSPILESYRDSLRKARTAREQLEQRNRMLEKRLQEQ